MVTKREELEKRVEALEKKVDDNKKEIDELHEHDVQALLVIAQKIEELVTKREELEERVAKLEKEGGGNGGVDLGNRLDALEKKVDDNKKEIDELHEHDVK